MMESLMKMKKNRWLCLYGLVVSLLVLQSSCTDRLPDRLTAFGDDVNYTITQFNPYLGRNTFFQNIVNIGEATEQPLDFNIVSVRNSYGEEVDDLTTPYPVKVWVEEYSGTETSLEEIENKRKIEYRPALEILRRSGNINFWGVDKGNVVTSAPDFGYSFDVEISSPGGRRYVRDLRVQPYIERSYEPSIYNPEVGLSLDGYSLPTIMTNIRGERDESFIFGFDVQVYINKDIRNTNPGSTLSFSFVDSLNNYIDPRKFDETDFVNLVHGFDHRFEDNKLVYDVAFPMPMTSRITRYTNEDGSRARANFLYTRMNEFNVLETAALGMDFAIFEEGHWEIQFRFRGQSPKFDD